MGAKKWLLVALSVAAVSRPAPVAAQAKKVTSNASHSIEVTKAEFSSSMMGGAIVPPSHRDRFFVLELATQDPSFVAGKDLEAIRGSCGSVKLDTGKTIAADGGGLIGGKQACSWIVPQGSHVATVNFRGYPPLALDARDVQPEPPPEPPALAPPPPLPPPPPPAACVPGQQVACACVGAGAGAQICLADGSGFAPCVCLAPTPVVPPAPPLAPEEPETDADGVPLARTGFQVAFRVGAAAPFGKVADELLFADVSDNFSWQAHLVHVELGSKVIPNLFIGGYVGGGIGTTAGALADECDRNSGSCIVFSARGGAEIQAHLLPAARANPWLGYGIGLEGANVLLDENFSVSALGVEWAHFMAGVDFRLAKRFGIGPFVNLALGHFFSLTTKSAGVETSHDISDPVMHGWFTFGARLVINP